MLAPVPGAGCGQYGNTLTNATGTVAYPRGSVFPNTTVAVYDPVLGDRDLGKPDGSINATPVALSPADLLVAQAAFDNFNRYEVSAINLKAGTTWNKLPHLIPNGSSGVWTIDEKGTIYGWSRDATGIKRATRWMLQGNQGPAYAIDDVNLWPRIPPGWQLNIVYASHAGAGIVGEGRLNGELRLFRIEPDTTFHDLGWPSIDGTPSQTAFVQAINANGVAVAQAVTWTPKVIQRGLLITPEGISTFDGLVNLPQGLEVWGGKGIDDENRILLRTADPAKGVERMILLTPIDPCALPWEHGASCVPATSCTSEVDGKACTDNNACTSADRCLEGVCIGKNKACNDGDACTVDQCSLGACTFSADPTALGCCGNVVAGQRLLSAVGGAAIYEENWEGCGNAMETRGSADATYSQDEAWSQCAPLAGARATSLTGSPVRTSWFKPIAVAPGGTYCLSAAIKRGDRGRPYVAIVRGNAQDDDIETNRLIGGDGPNGLGGTQIPLAPSPPAWRYYRAQFVVPADTTSLRIESGVDGATAPTGSDGTANGLDDLQVKTGTCP